MAMTTCPACATNVSVNLHIIDDASAKRTASVLKRCPGCGKWSWMKLQPQTT